MAHTMSSVSWVKVMRWLKVSVWAFPVVLALFFLVLIAFKISGSSADTYHVMLYGTQAKDSDLLYGHPRSIRSDEWLVGDSMLLSQDKNGFPRVNHDMTAGQDLTLQSEIPTKDWSAIFKPHLWGFFVLPVEYAFALKWWLVMYVLMVSCYFFILRILPGKRLFATLVALAAGLSPFELWWYQSGGFLSLAYGFLMLILLMRIFDREKVRLVKTQWHSDALHVLMLAFIISCFGLLLYPPFQISVSVVLLFFAVGYLLRQRLNSGMPWMDIWRRGRLVFLSVVLAVIVGGSFVATHRTPIDALNHTLYPGHRTINSGDMPILKVLDSFVMPLQQSDVRAGHFFANQSEAANFILLLPFLLLPGFALIAREWRLHRRIDWLFLALQTCGVLLLFRMFIPHGNFFFKLLLLHKVPNGRLVIGLGFLGLIHLVYFVKKIAEAKIPKKELRAWAMLYGLSCFIVLLWTGTYIREHYPLFIHNLGIITLLALAFTSIIVAILANKRTTAAILFAAFTLASSVKILPLYRGFGIPVHSAIVSAMEHVSKPNDTWVTVGQDSLAYENFGLLTGGRSISGTQVYANLKFWRQIGGPAYDKAYNREGNALYIDGAGFKQPVIPLLANTFAVAFRCDAFIKNNADFVLSVHPIQEPCLKQQTSVKYPNVTFYIYKVD